MGKRDAIIFNTYIYIHLRRPRLYAYSRVFAAENAPPAENSVHRSRPSPLSSFAGPTIAHAPVYTFLYCIFYTFSVYPFSRTRELQQIKLSLPAVSSSTGNCICLPTVRAYIRTLCTRAMRIQLRRDDFVSSMKICFRECPAVHAGKLGTEYIICYYNILLGRLYYFFIVNRET